MARSREEYNEYMRTYMNKRYHARRARAIEYLGGKCVDCGAAEKLEFDHIDPAEKTLDISGQSFSEERFMAELIKCELRCKPCHTKRTAQQQSVPHGSGLTGKKNCRCDLCRPLKQQYMKEKAYHKKRKPHAPDGRALDF